MNYHEFQDAVSKLTDEWENNVINDGEYFYQLGVLKQKLYAEIIPQTL